MEDDEGERKTKTISFTVCEDQFDVQDQAVFDALIDDEMKQKGREHTTRAEIVGSLLFEAITDLADFRFGKDRVSKIMMDAYKKQQRMNEEATIPPDSLDL